jgi:hypothetical protein
MPGLFLKKWTCLMLSLFFLSVMAASPGLCAGSKWYRGSLHCHTNVSDGDSTPAAVAEWYRTHGYDFIVITDHDKYTDVNERGLNSRKDFLVMPGEEVSMNIGTQEYHVNGINIKSCVTPARGCNGGELLHKGVDGVRKAGGIAQINHTFCKGRLTEGEIRSVNGFFLLEIHNALVSTGPDHEMLWDNLLIKGMKIYGTATDDAHYYGPSKKSDWGRPGKAWVVVRAPSLTAGASTKALRSGDFYATNGIRLSDISANDEKYRVDVSPEEGTTYAISFIGMGGQVFQKTAGGSAGKLMNHLFIVAWKCAGAPCNFVLIAC